MVARAGQRRLVLPQGALGVVTFSADIAAFAKASGASLDETVRAVTIELFTGVITQTPVDTGRARGNWQCTDATPAGDTIDRLDPTGSEAIAEIVAKAGGVGSVTYLTNNLPYILPLEEGHSTQSPPYAMVRGNFARVQSIVEAKARENRV